MKIELIKIGKPTTNESKTLVEMYLKRTKILNPIEGLEYKDLESLKGRNRSIFLPGQWVVALDERGNNICFISNLIIKTIGPADYKNDRFDSGIV